VRHLEDGERIELGGPDGVALEIMHTPGHTPESISVLVYEKASDEVPYGVLTGDALFIGDVGRPDLLASIGFTADELGRALYDSVQRKLMGLPDAVRVFPAHGAGSACGKNLSTELSSTIGQERTFNYACQPMSQDEFLAVVTAGQPSAPDYFVYDAVLNRKQRDVLPTDRAIPALDVAGLRAAIADGAIVVDTREAQEFATGHLVGSINIPHDGRFAETAGMVLDHDAAIVVIAPAGSEQEAATRLARIGFDGARGYLPLDEATFVALGDDVARASRLTPHGLDEVMAAHEAPWVVDVRNIGEREEGAIEGTAHIPLAELPRRLAEVPTDRPVVVHCAGGWRSSVAASYLRRAGFTDVSDLAGGFAAWTAMHAPVAS